MPINPKIRKSSLTWILRILCGGLFIFSGFVKAIDPWGTIFKFDEYLSALGLPNWPGVVVTAVFGLCAIEFVVGCFLLLGCFRKSCPIVAGIIMCLMVPLSLWLWIKNPIAECGCFGDALIISNQLTFIKNIILSGGIGVLIFYNTKAICLITPAFQWLAVVASGLFILIMEIFGYNFQPLLDFRNYPVGTSLYAHDNELNDDFKYIFVYQKNGVSQEFSIENIPEESEGWEFVERRDLNPETKILDNNTGLHVFDIESEEDITQNAINNNGKQLIVMIPEIEKVSPSTTWKLNALFDWCSAHDVTMEGIVAGSKEEIDRWEDLSMASYPIYLSDDTLIKEIVRGNPGIVYLENNIIIWKTSLYSMDVDQFIKNENSTTISAYGFDNIGILRNCSAIYLVFMAFLIFISFTPKMAKILLDKGLGSKKGIRHHE